MWLCHLNPHTYTYCPIVVIIMFTVFQNYDIQLTEGGKMLTSILLQNLNGGYRAMVGATIHPKSVGVIFGKAEGDRHLHVKTFDGSFLLLDGKVVVFCTCGAVHNFFVFHVNKCKMWTKDMNSCLQKQNNEGGGMRGDGEKGGGVLWHRKIF